MCVSAHAHRSDALDGLVGNRRICQDAASVQDRLEAMQGEPSHVGLEAGVGLGGNHQQLCRELLQRDDARSATAAGQNDRLRSLLGEPQGHTAAKGARAAGDQVVA